MRVCLPIIAHANVFVVVQQRLFSAGAELLTARISWGGVLCLSAPSYNLHGRRVRTYAQPGLACRT
jgi:hypothetical protein